ncbi:hypothetical protein A616_06265 [Brevibacillus brevis X23]|nr:hypothetical protein A616_06265 [Brevibacillus brevis X23]
MDKTQEILDDLRPLFEQAEREGLFFYSNYQQLWFSPQSLRLEQSKGHFIWGASNWQLRDPKERLQELLRKRTSVEREIHDFQLMMMD